MSQFKYTSWGRTRQPKNLAGAHGTEITLAANAAALTAATHGYSTENQRYLHILLIDTNTGANRTVTVYGYNHAFGVWAPLNQIGTSTAITATALTTSEDEGDQNASHREMVTFEVAGVDRVAFVGTAAHVKVFAAGSTF
tara:strand:- start:1004 stop:1423 length:420 start_codon:yes stop_codon:yes gene_type:complete